MKFWNRIFVPILVLFAVSVVAAFPFITSKVKEFTASRAEPLPKVATHSSVADNSGSFRENGVVDKIAESNSLQQDSHRLTVVTSKEPGFNQLLQSVYPGMLSNGEFKRLQNKVVLVHNDSKFPIHAFVIKWVIQSKSLPQSVEFTPYVYTQTSKHALVGGVFLAPDETRIISPWFSLSKSQYQRMATNKGNINQISGYFSGHEVTAKHTDMILSATVDGVVFDDASLVGVDEFGLKDLFECQRNGQHDEGISIGREFKRNAPDEQIIAKLNDHIIQGRIAEGKNDRESIYYAARGATAQMMLDELNKSGRAALEKVVRQTLRSKQINLKIQ